MKRARPKNKKAAEEKRKNLPAASEDSIYSGKKPKKAKKSPGKIILTLLLIIIAAVFVLMGFGLFDDTDILAPLEDGKINVLLLGVDEEGMRTDTIMLASYDVNEAKVNLLSIPRDTKIYVENRKVTRKINEIHAMSSKDKKGEILGAEATAEAVSQLTGAPINYYAEFSFSAIDHLFDILGPVEFDVPDVEGGGRGMNYDDPYQNLHIHLKPGMQNLSGNQVQQFLRYRKSNSGRSSGSDTDRVARQQDFVKAVVEQKLNPTILIKMPSIYSQLTKEIKTNISMGDITRYIRYVNKLTGESINAHSLPGEAKMIGGGSYFVCDLAATKTLMSETFGYTAEISDKVTLSEENSQKPLKAGNMGKKTDEPKKTEAPSEKDDKRESEKPSDTKAPTKAPTKEPADEPTKAPVVTKAPTKAPAVTKPPLEDMDDDFVVIDED